MPQTIISHMAETDRFELTSPHDRQVIFPPWPSGAGILRIATAACRLAIFLESANKDFVARLAGPAAPFETNARRLSNSSCVRCGGFSLKRPPLWSRE